MDNTSEETLCRIKVEPTDQLTELLASDCVKDNRASGPFHHKFRLAIKTEPEFDFVPFNDSQEQYIVPNIMTPADEAAEKHESCTLADERGRMCQECHEPPMFPTSQPADLSKYEHGRQFYCYTCNKSFKDESHVCCGGGKAAHVCAQCGKAYETRKKLLSHSYTHQKSVDKMCRICGKTFTLKSAVTRHMLRVHSIKRPHSCDECGKTFKTKSDVAWHVRGVHAKERPHSCSECGLAFKLKPTLWSHIKFVHKQERPHLCGTCGKGFKTNTSLSTHKKTVHSQDRPYCCQECTKNFKTVSALTQHVQFVHCTEKPFACSKCDKAFATRSSLVNHETTHDISGRPRVCRHCGLGFVKEEDYAKHATTHLLHCKGCGGQFKRLKELDNHKCKNNTTDKLFKVKLELIKQEK